MLVDSSQTRGLQGFSQGFQQPWRGGKQECIRQHFCPRFAFAIQKGDESPHALGLDDIDGLIGALRVNGPLYGLILISRWDSARTTATVKLELCCVPVADKIVGQLPQLEDLPPREPFQIGEHGHHLLPVVADPGQ